MQLKKNIYLSGFMGTGKTTAGKIAALRLGVPLLDLDAEIEKRTGLTISQIFTRKGEEVFRKLESEAILRTLQSPPKVVALGGGAVLSPLNRDVFRRGIWINLNANPAVIEKRVAGSKTRPLLKKKATRASIESLLNPRLPYYRLAEHQVETSSLSPDAVADDVLRIVRKKL